MWLSAIFKHKRRRPERFSSASNLGLPMHSSGLISETPLRPVSQEPMPRDDAIREVFDHWDSLLQ
jgi:hypothetical protein